MIDAAIRIFARVISRRIKGEGINFDEAIKIYPKLTKEDIERIKEEMERQKELLL